LSFPFDITNWWSIYVSVNAYHANYKGTDDRFLAIDQSTATVYGQNSFVLPKGFKLEVSGWFSSPSIWGGTFLTKSLGSVDIAVQKKFLEDKLSIRLAAGDVFFTSFWRANMEFGDLKIIGHGGQESQLVRLNVSYRFGSSEVKTNRKRKTGLEEEEQRVGNGS